MNYRHALPQLPELRKLLWRETRGARNQCASALAHKPDNSIKGSNARKIHNHIRRLLNGIQLIDILVTKRTKHLKTVSNKGLLNELSHLAGTNYYCTRHQEDQPFS